MRFGSHQYMAITEPKIDWAGEDRAPGRAVKMGSGKCLVANTTASAELV